MLTKSRSIRASRPERREGWDSILAGPTQADGGTLPKDISVYLADAIGFHCHEDSLHFQEFNLLPDQFINRQELSGNTRCITFTEICN